MKRMNAECALILFTLLSSTASYAGDWPQWRGPNRDGISQETGLLKEWPKEGPRLIWQVKDIGSGFSTPSISGGRAFLLANTGLDNEYVLALSVKDGKQIWSKTIGKVGEPQQQPNYPAARSTPTVEGDVLYAIGSAGDLACLRTADGEPVWRKSFRNDFSGAPGRWAYAESPLIDGELLVCTPGGKEATVVALNKKTGDVVWKCAVPGGDQAAYASAIIVEIDGSKQYVQFLQNGLIGIEAKSGKFLWRYEKTAKGSMANIPTPVAADGLIYSGAGRTGGGGIKLKRADASFEVEQLYYSPKLPTAIGGAIRVKGPLFGATSQALVCADFVSGEIKWEERSIAPASLIYADDRLYLHGEEGSVALVEASSEGYHEEGRFTPPDRPERGGSKAWAYPAIANGQLFIREGSSLWAYDVALSK